MTIGRCCPELSGRKHKESQSLSEALRRSIANKGLYSAKSKDPGDADYQMLSGASGRKLHRDEAEWRDLLFFPQLRFVCQ